MQYYFLL
ncbi:putative membrane protein, partial [Yersinia pestis PY-66]